MIKLNDLSESVFEVLKDNEAVRIYGGATSRPLPLNDLFVGFDPTNPVGSANVFLGAGTGLSSFNLSVSVPKIPNGIR